MSSLEILGAFFGTGGTILAIVYVVFLKWMYLELFDQEHNIKVDDFTIPERFKKMRILILSQLSMACPGTEKYKKICEKQGLDTHKFYSYQNGIKLFKNNSSATKRPVTAGYKHKTQTAKQWVSEPETSKGAPIAATFAANREAMLTSALDIFDYQGVDTHKYDADTQILIHTKTV